MWKLDRDVLSQAVSSNMGASTKGQLSPLAQPTWYFSGNDLSP